MNLPDDCTLTYTVSMESWYRDVTDAVRTGKPDMMIGASASDGGVAWEFRVIEHDFSQNPARHDHAVQVCMFGDAFDAWEQVPEIFTALREEVPSTLAEVRAILDRIGAVDATDRVGPYGGKSVEQMRAERLREQAAELLREADDLAPLAEEAR